MGNNAGSAAGGGAIYGLGIFGAWVKQQRSEYGRSRGYLVWPPRGRGRPPFIRSG